MTTELLGLHPPGVCNQQSSVICHQLLLQLHRTGCVDVLCVVCDESTSDSLSDGVNLGSVSSTLYAHTDVERCEGVFASDQNGLIHLQTKDLGLNEVYGGAVDPDEPSSLFSVGNRCCCLYVRRGASKFHCKSRNALTQVPSFYRMSERPLWTPF